MAYLTFTASEESNSGFKFIGMSNTKSSGGLITSDTSLISDTVSLLSAPSGSENLDSCSFYSGPSDSTIMAFGESAETCGSIAYSGAETCGSIAYSGGAETCGSIASSSSSSSSSSGGGCSYCC